MAARRLLRPLLAAGIRLRHGVQSNPRSIDSCSFGPCNRFCLSSPQLFSRRWSMPLSGCGVRGFASGDLPPHIVLGMPALSPTMTQGNVVTWKKKEGDQVLPGDVLCVIETDKATVDFESVEEGYLAKILVPAGTNNVQVGQVVGVMAENAEDIAKVASGNFGSGGSSSKPAGPPPSSKSSAPEAKSSPPSLPADLPPHIVLGMPALSPTMTQGNVVNWKKKEGDAISPGDVLCVIETDKATVDFESVEEGFLAKIIVSGGSNNVQIGQTIGIMVEDKNDISKVAKADCGAKQPASPSPSAGPKPSASAPAKVPSPVKDGGRASRVGPSVRRLLAESGLDGSAINGTGPRGAVLKGDVLAAMKSGGATKARKDAPKHATKDAPASRKDTSAAVSYEDKPTSQIRKVIAKRLLESKSGIPHCYISADAELDGTLQLRKEIKEQHGVTVSVNDFVIRATALALRAVPEANSYWNDQAGDVALHGSVDISIAVATEKGLLTPIVRNADLKSLSTISTEVKSLAERARQGKLKPEEFQGGTFSISNLGMFPVDRFCAIINPPQACILAVGRGEKHVVWDESSGEAKPRVVTKMGLTLSADARVYDDTLAGRFLEALAANLEDPKRMLL